MYNSLQALVFQFDVLHLLEWILSIAVSHEIAFCQNYSAYTISYNRDPTVLSIVLFFWDKPLIILIIDKVNTAAIIERTERNMHIKSVLVSLLMLDH